MRYTIPLGGTVLDYEPTGFAQWLARPRRYLSVDVETTGLGWGDTVRVVQVGDSDTAWVLPPDGDLLRPVLQGRMFVAWNAAFDAEHLRRLTGVDILPYTSDTAVLAGVLDPRATYQGGVGRGLKEWAAARLGEQAGLPERDLYAMFKRRGWTRADGWRLIDTDHPVYVRYAGADVVYTHRLHQILTNDIRARAAVVRREQQVAQIVARLRARGFLLDAEYTEQRRLHYAAELTDTMLTLSKLGVTKVGSSKQIAQRLEEEGLEDFIEYTELHNVSVPKSVLKKARVSGSTAAPLVLRAKRAKRLGRDYLEAYQAAAAVDGRVHPNIHPIGAKTRRMSSSRPNLQNVPKDMGIRRCFIPDPGEVLLDADYRQMELRYAAGISGDQALTEDLAEGDPFPALAEQVWPGQGQAKRGTAKVMSYMTIYGGGAKALSEVTGQSPSEARALQRAFWRKYRVLNWYSDNARRGLKARGGVELPRSGWLPSRPDKAYVALNLLIQGGCRDAFGERLVAMDAAGLTPFLRHLVHDEAIWSVPEDLVEDVVAVIRSTMPITDLSVPIPVDIKIGRSWEEMKKW